ncbi:MAG: hypothetical protein M1828_001204 [Chrysothrix sp. TS-e1954]|nr:MAG: hypothetical protein M1828_001204 [Chrysothrix sp. TS-e1954]
MERERHAEQDYMADAWGSGRSSHEGSELLDEDSEFMSDGTARQGSRREDSRMQQGDGTNGTSDDGEGGLNDDGDESLDDDMVDKISSSPSIDDGRSLWSSPPSDEQLAPPVAAASDSLLSPLRSSRQHHHLGRKYFEFDPDQQMAGIQSGMPTIDRIPDLAGVQLDGSADEAGDSTSVGSSTASRDISEGSGRRIDIVSRSSSASIANSLLLSTDTKRSSSYEGDNDNDDDDDDLLDTSFPSDPRMIDSGWGGECLRETEDIDFEFVYALHTFVATVEGQANATKGDTMVLLDDSNSYWWLVRVAKDNSIGYLPAEHIETPTERLARLNKHRNIDLSAAMLGDNQEKSKNPLKKAIRRRQAKIVTFSAPTYYEPSDVEWSDAEDEPNSAEGEPDSTVGKKVEQASQEENVKRDRDLNAQAQVKERLQGSNPPTSPGDTASETSKSVGDERQSEDSFNSQDSTPNSRSRNGTMRNTDSFFKDNTAEPKKMTLTPGLLREQEGDESPRSSESKEKASSPVTDVFDQVEKAGLVQTDKKTPRSKEKKSGMLSGLFKRKEKKIKVDEAAGGVVASSKHDGDILASPSSLSSQDSIASPVKERPPSKRPGGKLVKQPPPSSGLANSGLASPTGEGPKSLAERQPTPLGGRPAEGVRSPPPGMQRLAARDEGSSRNDGKPPSLRIRTQQSNDSMQSDNSKREHGLLSPLSNLVSPPNGNEQPKEEKHRKEKLKKAKQRMELDVESSPEDINAPSPQSAMHNDASDIQSNPPQTDRNLNVPPPARSAPSIPSPTAPYYPEPDSGPSLSTTGPGAGVSPIDPRVTAPNYTSTAHPNTTTSTLGESPVSTPYDSTPPDTPPTTSTFSRGDQPQSQSVSATASTSASHSPNTAPDSPASSQFATNTPTGAPRGQQLPPTTTRDPAMLTPTDSAQSSLQSLSVPSQTPSHSQSHPQAANQWNHARLREYLDSGAHASDVRNLLLVVGDRSGVKAVGRDHPIMKQYGYAEHERTLDEMSRRLDGMLAEYVGRRDRRARARVDGAGGGGAGG